MKDTGFGVSFEVIRSELGVSTTIDNNLPISKWDKRRMVL